MTSENVTNKIDFSKYKLESLGSDIRTIVNVSQALSQTAKSALFIPILIGIPALLFFYSRMTGWVLIPFLLITYLLSLLAAVLIGGFVVARKRLDILCKASNQVVETVGRIHIDIVKVQDGQASTSVREVAVGIAENAVFPAVFGSMEDIRIEKGPFAKLTSSVSPIHAVKHSVVSAIELLPDREIGSNKKDNTTVDILNKQLPEISTEVHKLTSDYEGIRNKVDGIVAKVSRTAQGSAVTLTVLGAIPLILWLILGLIFS